ncbi:MAG: BlaI/MecI/CopY family transcriptional regulator [Lachnospiraceae bacterium]|nr:BlaI/MecI/CopY family transcriptional regulator [Lachnospiraceae bacterium]
MTKLSDAEWKIMDILWRDAPKTLMELTRELEEETGWAKTTVITFLKRMEEKGAVSYEERGRTKYFSPAIDRADAELEETRSFLEKVFRGNVGLMISNMVKQEAISDEELEELYRILREGKKDV